MQNAVRRQFGERFSEIEIVAELGARSFLPSRTFEESRPLDHISSPTIDEIGVLGEALDQDGARAVQGCCNVRHLFFGIHDRGGDGLRIFRRLREQEVGQRLKPGLPWRFRPWCAASAYREDRCLRAGPLLSAAMMAASRAASSLPCSRIEFEDDGAAVPPTREIVEPLLECAQTA